MQQTDDETTEQPKGPTIHRTDGPATNGAWVITKKGMVLGCSVTAIEMHNDVTELHVGADCFPVRGSLEAALCAVDAAVAFQVEAAEKDRAWNVTKAMGQHLARALGLDETDVLEAMRGQHVAETAGRLGDRLSELMRTGSTEQQGADVDCEPPRYQSEFYEDWLRMMASELGVSMDFANAPELVWRQRNDQVLAAAAEQLGLPYEQVTDNDDPAGGVFDVTAWQWDFGSPLHVPIAVCLSRTHADWRRALRALLGASWDGPSLVPSPPGRGDGSQVSPAGEGDGSGIEAGDGSEATESTLSRERRSLLRSALVSDAIKYGALAPDATDAAELCATRADYSSDLAAFTRSEPSATDEAQLGATGGHDGSDLVAGDASAPAASDGLPLATDAAELGATDEPDSAAADDDASDSTHITD